MKSLRELAPQRQSTTTAVEDVLDLAAELADHDPYAGLSGSARELLKAYVVLADEYAGVADRPGASWASDAEVAMRIGSSKSTVRRARSELAEAAHLRVEYIAPFHRLPTGEASLHGTNVVTVLALMGSGMDVNKSAPRAVSAARGASQPPTEPEAAMTPPGISEASMDKLHEHFTPDQVVLLHALVEGSVNKSQGVMAKYVVDQNTPLYQRLVAVETRQRGGGGATGSSSGAVGGTMACDGSIASKPLNFQRVHIMPQLGDSPERSPTSSVEFVLPRAA